MLRQNVGKSPWHIQPFRNKSSPKPKDRGPTDRTCCPAHLFSCCTLSLTQRTPYTKALWCLAGELPHKRPVGEEWLGVKSHSLFLWLCLLAPRRRRPNLPPSQILVCYYVCYYPPPCYSEWTRGRGEGSSCVFFVGTFILGRSQTTATQPLFLSAVPRSRQHILSYLYFFVEMLQFAYF